MLPESNRGGRSLTFHVWTAALCLFWTLPLYGQGERPTDPLLAIFLTWGPVLLIVGLWIYFMKKFSGGGSKNYFQRNQELMASIDARLGRIADSLEGLVEEIKKGR